MVIGSEVTDLTDLKGSHQRIKAKGLRFGPAKRDFLGDSLSLFLSFFLSFLVLEL